MTRLFNDPADFAEELAAGFVAAHPAHVRTVAGGVVRRTATPDGTVAVVVGGGSGHYPAFAGLVGRGLAHGAAMGNMFASPSARQVYDVCKAADRGAGVVLSFGNYAGDVLQFGQAAERLKAEGIPTETVVVTDDIASAAVEESHKRRGIAGDLVVFKVAGAVADAGGDIDDVARAARRANDRTRSFGVAFGGCTLPGADEPLFTVADGTMSLGLGIHGEPGISEAPMPTADELAELFVEKVLAERPAGAGDRVAVLLNGLGTVKYEELFVVYRRIDELLADVGLTVVAPEVGELCTSLDMAGASLTLCWLDDDLERHFLAPADAPAYRRGGMDDPRFDDVDAFGNDAAHTASDPKEADGSAAFGPVGPGTDESRAAVPVIVEALRAARHVVTDRAEELGRIDAVAGDGDHGIGMERGVRAAVDAAENVAADGAGAASVLRRAGEAWADTGGGTSGALWGVLLSGMARVLGDADAVDRIRVVDAVAAGVDDVKWLGQADIGDKTMLDVLDPFSRTLTERVAAGETITAAWQQAATVADQAAAATAELVPKIGRARPLADKSVGTPDAGAVSAAAIAGVIVRILDTRHEAHAPFDPTNRSQQ